MILTQAFNATHPDFLSNQINDFLRENDIQKIIDIKYSSFKEMIILMIILPFSFT
jgi:hypothetical protein